MNSLSWMIYAAEVAERASAVCGILGVLGSVAAAAVFAISHDTYLPSETKERLRRQSLFCAKVGPLLIALAVITPSSKAIYAIAASEMGETALNSETGGKAVKALNAWLDRQLEDGESGQ